ncbi:MAG: CRISPR-associated endonuclease Cas1 [Candidatus Pacebacteria bacterium]|nr:CRISPR-associated endonuclease Cas1 [Candidatus Paceibacterota bacterium]
MLTLPDFKEKQILFIKGNNNLENTLKFSNENLIFYKNGKKHSQLSCYKILAIFLYGDFSVTTVLLRKFDEYGIAVFFLKNNLMSYCYFNLGLGSNYLLRIKQYKQENEINIAKKIIRNKIYNSHLLLKKYNYCNNSYNLDDIFSKITKAEDLKTLLGIEGSFSRNYFLNLFCNKEVNLNWRGRQPRLKQNMENVLLDIGYTFLFNFIDSILNLFGFDTYKGFCHQVFFKRKSLSCDIMEPFRCIIDETLYLMFKNKEVNSYDFDIKQKIYSLKYNCSKKYCQAFLQAILKNKIEIYKYIRNFYYYILNDKEDFNKFILK